MRVLRIETTCGKGLYGSSLYEDSLASKLCDYFPFEGCDEQPTPSKDGLSEAWTRPYDQYAFASATQMLDWLNGCPVDELYAKGGRVIVIDVKEAEYGFRQCRFHPDAVLQRKPLKLHDLKKEILHDHLHRDSN